MSKKKDNEKRGTFILIVAVIICIVIGVAAIVKSFKKADKAAKITDKILYYYMNGKK